jgi:hypothetical protein
MTRTRDLARGGPAAPIQGRPDRFSDKKPRHAGTIIALCRMSAIADFQPAR